MGNDRRTTAFPEPETVQEMPIEEYWQRHAENRATPYPVIIRRVSPSYARRILRAERGRAYSCEIQKKYNVGPDWQHGELKEPPGPHLGKRILFAMLPVPVQKRYNREAGFSVTVKVSDTPGIW